MPWRTGYVGSLPGFELVLKVWARFIYFIKSQLSIEDRQPSIHKWVIFKSFISSFARSIGVGKVMRFCFLFSCFAGSWEESDQPEIVHAELFPQCPFVQGQECGNRPLEEWRRQEVAAEILNSGSLFSFVMVKLLFRWIWQVCLALVK